MITISVDVSDIANLITQNVMEQVLQGMAEDTMTSIHVDLTSSPPIGTPVDTGAARNSWQLDLPNLEVYTKSPYMLALNNGHSKQSPSNFIDAIKDKHTR